MNAQQKRYAILAGVVVVAILAGVGARFAMHDPLVEAVATGDALGTGEPGARGDGAKTPAERAEGAATAAQKEATALLGTGPAAPATPGVPSFDVVRVEPSGSALIAGRTAPEGEVELLSGDRVIARVKSNAAGEFVVMPDALAPGDYDLKLRDVASGSVSARSVVVSIPAGGAGGGEVLVVASEPGKPSTVLQAGSESAGVAATPPTQQTASVAETAASADAASDAPLRIGSVEAEGGRLFVQGTGPAGSRAAIYLNETPIADAVVGPDGRWSLTVERGISAGAYGIRVDQVDGSGKVVARAEVPFDFTPSEAARVADAGAAGAGAAAPSQTVTALAAQSSGGSATSGSAPEGAASGEGAGPAAIPLGGEGGPAASQAPVEGSSAGSTDAGGSATAYANAQSGVDPAAAAASSAGSSANPVVAEIGTVSVRRGDSLWRISRSTYGAGMRYTVIYEANNAQIRNPDLIYPGQVFVLPPRT